MKCALKQYDVVRVIAIRDQRFVHAQVFYDRLPKVGDIGTILEVYAAPELGYEVECSNSNSGATIWLDAMYPGEIELVQEAVR